MGSPQLDTLAPAELARRLAGCRRHSAEWHALQAECRKRAARWGRVMQYAGWGIAACLLLTVSITLLPR